MAKDRTENLPIYKDARALRLQVLDSYEHFPRKYRYTLGTEIIEKSAAFFDYVVEGCVQYDKKKSWNHSRMQIVCCISWRQQYC